MRVEPVPHRSIHDAKDDEHDENGGDERFSNEQSPIDPVSGAIGSPRLRLLEGYRTQGDRRQDRWIGYQYGLQPEDRALIPAHGRKLSVPFTHARPEPETLRQSLVRQSVVRQIVVIIRLFSQHAISICSGRSKLAISLC